MHLPTIPLLALWLGLARAQLLPMNLPSRGMAADLPAGNMSPAMLFIRATGDCASGAKGCDDGCIPTGGQCCNSGQGGWCSRGTRCQSGGCCPDGQACPGPATSCPGGTEFCGDKCMPRGARCCGSNLYFCAAGSTCTANGLCDDGRGERGCTADEDTCGGGCMPAGKRCCSTHYCATEFNCGSGPFECAPSISQGGKGSGGGSAALCDGDFESCGISCMPKEGVCCDGFYCPAGSSCAPDQKCATSDGVAGGSNSTATATSTPSSTSSQNPSNTGAETTQGGAITASATRAALLAIFVALVQVAI